MTKSERRRTGLCAKCLKKRVLEKHHIRPLRFYNRNSYVIRLCTQCHREMEIILSCLENERGGQLKTAEYHQIIKDFIRRNDY